MHPTRKSTIVVLALLLVAAVPIGLLTWNPNWLSQLAYAVEVGKAQASQEQLAVATNLSEAFQHVAQALRPSVVSISSVRHVSGRSQPFRFGPSIPEEFRQFFDEDFFDRQFEFRTPDYDQYGLGSGVIVREDGYILTNNHVVADADELNVTLSDGRQLRAQVVGTDRPTDLAVLKIDAKNLQPARLGDSNEMQVGQWVLAVGSPFGLDQTVTAGIISAKGRTVGILASGGYEDFIQTDAAINPGNSGGPLVNLKGEVIGINTAIASRTGGYMGVGFAIPSAIADYVVDSIVQTGHVTRGWLGAYIQDVTTDAAESFGYDSTEGVLIQDVQKDSPAAKAGLKPGDIAIRLNGRKVQNANELRTLVAKTKPNERVELEIFRGGQRQTVPVVIGTLDESKLAVSRPSENNRESVEDLGITVRTLTPEIAQQLGYDEQARGAVVTEVAPGRLGARAGLRPKDVIVRVGDTEVTSAQEFRDALKDQSLADGVRLQVITEGIRRFVFLRAR